MPRQRRPSDLLNPAKDAKNVSSKKRTSLKQQTIAQAFERGRQRGGEELQATREEKRKSLLQQKRELPSSESMQGVPQQPASGNSDRGTRSSAMGSLAPAPASTSSAHLSTPGSSDSDSSSLSHGYASRPQPSAAIAVAGVSVSNSSNALAGHTSMMGAAKCAQPVLPDPASELAQKILDSKAAFERAVKAQEALPETNKERTWEYGYKCVASDGKKTLSGWGESITNDLPKWGLVYERSVTPEIVLQKMKDIDHPKKLHPNFDQGKHGYHYASHAERQASIANPDDPLGVVWKMCSDCQAYFKKLAQWRRKVQVVTDPEVTRIFHPDGTVELREK